MSDDVRKSLRTQGRYSDGKGQKSRDKKHKYSLDSSETKFSKRSSDGNKSANSSLTDETVSPVKYEENSDYTFDQLQKVAKPEEIKGRGEIVLSKTDEGESRIFFEPRFLHDDEGEEYFERLYTTINWDTRNIVIHGVEYPQPRLVAWFGPFPYSYSGTTLEPAEMPDVVMEIKEKVEMYLKHNGIEATFNSVLINLYRDGKDSVSWHSDDELMLGISPTIASVSLGETRKFEIRPKMRNYDDQSPSNGAAKFFVHLTHGSLIIMTGCMQDDWQHRVPKEYHDRDPRINLTFRTVYPLEKAPGHFPVKEINLETGRKQSRRQNVSSKALSSSYKLDDEHFPSLQKNAISANSNVTCDVYDNPKNLNHKLKKDVAIEECWDSEISNNGGNVESAVTPKNTFSAFDKRDEDFKLKNNEKNNFSNEKMSEKGHNIEPKSDNVKFDDKTATKKLWSDEYDSSDFPENNTSQDRCEMNSYKSVNNSSTNEIQGNTFFKQIDQKKVYDKEISLIDETSHQNSICQVEYSIKSCNIKTTSYINATQGNGMDNEEPPNTCYFVKSNSWVDSSEESNLSMNKTTKVALNVDPKACMNAAQENNLDNETLANSSRYVEGNLWVYPSEESHLDLKKPTKMALNVDAKEFIPNNMKSNEASQYSELKLEDLINCDINSLHGRNLQDHAQNLKKQVFLRFQEINRFERNELEFLLEITDGSQNDKNQRLISSRIGRIVQNNFLVNQLPHVVPSFDRSSRHRNYENQGYYSDKGKRYPNQSRHPKNNRSRF